MSGINNFITDLIEEMKPRGVSSLIIPVGSFCLYKRGDDTIFGTRHRAKIDLGELTEDFEALGINVRKSGTWYYRHDPTGLIDGESLYYAVMVTENVDYHGVEVVFIENPDKLFKDILRDNNPVTREEFHEYAY